MKFFEFAYIRTGKSLLLFDVLQRKVSGDCAHPLLDLFGLTQGADLRKYDDEGVVEDIFRHIDVMDIAKAYPEKSLGVPFIYIGVYLSFYVADRCQIPLLSSVNLIKVPENEKDCVGKQKT